MDLTEFWRTIELAKNESGGSLDRRYRALLNRLMDLPGGEIVEFELRKDELIGKANQWDLWAAAYIINGGCSDDGFLDFRQWLVSRGETAYKASLSDPESLIEWVRGEGAIFFEAFGWVTEEAYKMATGRHLWEDMPGTTPSAQSGPSGVGWNTDEELASRFPKLHAAFHGRRL